MTGTTTASGLIVTGPSADQLALEELISLRAENKRLKADLAASNDKVSQLLAINNKLHRDTA